MAKFDLSDLGGTPAEADLSDLGGTPIAAVAAIDLSDLGGTPAEAVDLSDLGGTPTTFDLSDLGGVPAESPSLGQRALDLGLKAITPIPLLEESKRALIEKAGEVLGAARPEILKEAETDDPLNKALLAARNAIIPLPTPALAEAAGELALPVAPLDLIGTFAAPLIRPLMRVFGQKATAKIAEKVVRLTPEESVRHLDELGRATKGPDPLILPVTGSTPRETMLNALGRQARPRLSSEIALQGADQTSESMRAIAQEAIDRASSGKPLSVQGRQQVSEAVAAAVKTGELDPSNAARILGMQMEKSGDPAAFAQIILDRKSQQGRDLAQWSRVAAALKKHFSGNKAVQDLLNKAPAPELTPYGKVAETYRYADNLRRAAMVSQLATTARNILSQGARYSIGLLEDASSGILGKLTGKAPNVGALDNAMQDAISLISATGKNNRKVLDDIFERFPIEAARLVGTPIGDVAIDGKIARFLNTFNTWQELKWRKTAFDARLRQSVALAGRSIDDVKSIKFSEIVDAVDHSLETTFAKSPVSGAGKAFLRLYKEIPFLTAVGNPFPRFWLNAMRFVVDFSPIPLFSPRTYSAMAHADPRIAFKAISRASLGSTFIAAGAALDEMGLTGERWYEIKGPRPDDPKRFDTRAFGPFTAQLFAGRLVNRLRKKGTEAVFEFDSQDWTQAFLAMKRADATGIPLLDILFSRTRNEFKRNVTRLASGYVSSFTPGLLTRTPQDIIGQFSEADRTPRFTREKPLLGDLQASIPFLSRELPPRPSPLREGVELKESPLLRQLTGITFRVKTPLEMETDRLRITPRAIYPHTGTPELDRLIVEKMGPMIAESGGALIENKGYLAMEDKMKKFVLDRMIKRFKSASTRIVKGQSPKTVFDDMIKRSPEFLRDDLRAAFDQEEDQ